MRILCNVRQVILAVILLASASFVIAEGTERRAMEQVVYQAMTRDGFTQVELTYTWLGRLQVVASNHSRQRELVIDPDTGEVLRDFYTLIGTQENNENPLSRLRHALGLDLDGVSHSSERTRQSSDENSRDGSEADFEDSEGRSNDRSERNESGEESENED